MTDVLTDPRLAGTRGQEDADRVIGNWLDQFHTASAAHDAPAVADLFVEDATARDLLVLSWDLRNAVGREGVATLLTDHETGSLRELGIVRTLGPDYDEDEGRRTLEGFLRFSNDKGSGDGYVLLVEDAPGEWKAAAVSLALTALDGYPALIDDNRPHGRIHGPISNRVTWQDQLDRDLTTTDPTVVILGAGHNGLMLAARLKVLGIPALVVDRNERVGDNWRNRYTSLHLHTPLPSDHLPYIPFPSTWTKFTPKDKLGDFLECYATLLDLRIWTGSHAENVHYDGETKRWTMEVVRADGERRPLAPAHLVFATGMNGEPYLPDLPGREQYRGTLIHAVQYRGSDPWVGKKAVVVGAGVSGHDLGQDLAENGVDVTMIQRSGVVVMNTSSFHTVMHSKHIGGRYTTEEADLLNAATPFGMLPSHGSKQLAKAHELDRDVLEGLEKAGFELSDGPDGQGVLGLIFGQNATGYYFNAGASELIIDGTIKLEHGTVTELTETGVALDDGRTLDADLVIFATGYRGATTAVRELLGEGIADRVGDFAKVGEDGEFGRLWRRTGVEGLWFMITLGLDAGRFYSQFLALQIAAIEAGSMPATTERS